MRPSSLHARHSCDMGSIILQPNDNRRYFINHLNFSSRIEYICKNPPFGVSEPDEGPSRRRIRSRSRKHIIALRSPIQPRTVGTRASHTSDRPAPHVGVSETDCLCIEGGRASAGPVLADLRASVRVQWWS